MIQLSTFMRMIRDTRGSIAVEFALLGPLMIALMLGVIQIGWGMQSYNSVRQLTAETARYAMVEYQKESDPSRNAIQTYAEGIADNAPYLLDEDNLTVTVSQPGTQRVAGAIEYSIVINYTVPTIMNLFDWASPTFSFTRPVFLLDNTP